MRKRVLIVDDEPSIVTSLEFLMQRCGFDTLSVTDGGEVLAQVDAFSPDLVLLDVMLPGRSGFDLCREIRSRHGRTRVMLLTAMGAKSDLANGVEAGADDYLTKPFSTHELVDRVRALLEPAAGGAP